MSKFRSNVFQFRWLWSHSSILTILLVISVGLNALLAKKVNDLSTITRLLRLRLDAPVLVEGSSAPTLSARDLDGKRVEISYADSEKPTVLYIFTPECHWCAQNLQNIKFLANCVGDRYRFIGVSMASTNLPAYLAASQLPFKVYHTPPEEVSIAYGFNSTPTTVMVSPQGQILQYWRGAYSEDLQAKVENAFRVKLPGLIAEPEPKP